MTPTQKRSITFSLLALWVVGVVSGFWVLFTYKSTPGAARESPAGWPAQSSIRREPGHSTLVMLVHPKCPCTRASVSELGRLMPRLGTQVNAHVLVLRPSGTPPQWEQTDLWKSASGIPGVSVMADVDGTEAARFGALTSGHVLLYDKDGTLQFSGGITASRGHEGDSFGKQRIVALVNGLPADRPDSPVFGCSLFEKALATDLRKE